MQKTIKKINQKSFNFNFIQHDDDNADDNDDDNDE